MSDRHLKEDLKRVQNLEDLAANLEFLLNSGPHVFVKPDGEQILLFGRALVEKINGLKIHIYPDEHAPPHFHVKSPNFDAAFTIDKCAFIKGSIDSKTRALIVYWHGSARRKLIEIWNKTRPTDCPVGPILDEF
jgi:hypothetical protein